MLNIVFCKMSYKSYGLMFLIFVVYLTFVWCEETEVTLEKSDTNLIETGRRRHGFGGIGGHRWWGIYGLHALAVFYFLKVKAVIVAFLFGSALVWGFRYFKQQGHGCPEIIQESPLISYEHGPSWSSGPHDHIPYSLDHNPFEHDHDHEHSHFSSSDIVSDSEPYSSYSDAAPTAPSSPSDDNRRRGRQLESEEQVSEIMFNFLGVNNAACRRRFICEMEFRSKESPITRMAFGIIGRGLFSKYVNNKNVNGRATSFDECAIVNPDCSLVEENIDNNNENEVNQGENEGRSFNGEPRDLENENEANLNAELESTRTSTSATTDPIAQAIFSRSQVVN